MNVVDSSGWLEYFADGSNAEFFAGAVENTVDLIVPTITLFEVFKRVLQLRGETEALHAVAQMQQGKVIVVDAALAIDAARTSFEMRLPMADSLILTTARRYEAELWTQDSDFAGIGGVRYKGAV
ncbi:MAG TPA: type II toxin-antitoxin system VapC family toxin [Rhodothermales bacterium]|nr:type II toxin-antitoxin system VapC family toxin [Rhodothermales bacterium]